MDIDYIIVQAGGQGTRLEYLTANKPKALVPVDNLPMLFHLFRQFPDKQYIVIADYKKEVLKKYLESFAEVKYLIVDAVGSGTCGGLRRALNLVPAEQAVLVVWSDLILPTSFSFPEKTGNYVGISQSFSCRWSFTNGEFVETPSEKHGVAGLFIFEDKSHLDEVPESGEFVRWLKKQNLYFDVLGLDGTKEIGLLAEYKKLKQDKTRPFNKMTFDQDVVIKEPLDQQGASLAEYEQGWYRHALSLGITDIPQIYSFSPLKMEKIQGKNIYAYNDLNYYEKKRILQTLIESINALHHKESVPADIFSLREAYYTKTMARLRKVRDLIPFASDKHITVNGKKCRNVFFYQSELERRIEALRCDKFVFIHGDCTFSNILLRQDGTPVLIDPRGYFGFTTLYGDPNYDWAKLYYSIVGNYDRFNLKDFRLKINNDSVDIKIASNHWEDMEQCFFELSGADPQVTKLLHAVIWLSLTTYAWQDYDSICGAFYNGLSYLEEVL